MRVFVSEFFEAEKNRIWARTLQNIRRSHQPYLATVASRRKMRARDGRFGSKFGANLTQFGAKPTIPERALWFGEHDPIQAPTGTPVEQLVHFVVARGQFSVMPTS